MFDKEVFEITGSTRTCKATKYSTTNNVWQKMFVKDVFENYVRHTNVR